MGLLLPLDGATSENRNDVTLASELGRKLKTQMKELQAIEIQLNESPDKQVSLTDPDARSMMTRGTGVVGYNVQTAVDTQHHLIVANEVTNVGSDRDQLSSMAKQAREAIASETLSVVADRGYFKSEQILACHDAGITAYSNISCTYSVGAMRCNITHCQLPRMFSIQYRANSVCLRPDLEHTMLAS